MSQFEDRERAEEAKYALDQQTRFKVEARRNKMLGLWAADLLGLSGEEADVYARAVMRADLEEAGDEDVFRKVRGDFDTKGVSITDGALREKMAELFHEAREQVTKGE